MTNNGNGLVVWEGLPVARSLDEFAAGVRRIATFQKQFKWRLAEWLHKNEEAHGDKIWQWVDELGYSHPQISNMLWVYRTIGDQYDAKADLTFDTWRELASLTREQRKGILQADKKISRDEIRAMTHKNGAAPSEPTPLIDALLLVGKLLSLEAKGEDVADRLSPALDELIAEAIQKKAKIDERNERRV
jgi:hypothetical protein